MWRLPPRLCSKRYIGSSGWLAPGYGRELAFLLGLGFQGAGKHVASEELEPNISLGGASRLRDDLCRSITTAFDLGKAEEILLPDFQTSR